jgi:arabinosaccharide transport system substrate-binding protein
MTLNRRAFLRGAALTGGAVMLPSVLSACGGGGTSEQAVKSGKVSLAMWTHDPGYEKTFTQSAEMFTKSGETDYEYALKIFNSDGDSLITKMISNAQSGSSNTPDMIGIIISTFNRLMTGNIAPSLLHDWTDEFAELGDDLLPSRVAPYTMDGKPYAVESDNCTTVLYYREDLFDKFKVPLEAGSWEEMADAGAKLFSDQGASLGVACTGDNTSASNQFLQFLAQRGGNFFDAEGNLAIESPESVEVLQFMVDGVKSGFLLDVPDPYGPAMNAALKSSKVISVTMPDWYNPYGLQTAVPEQKGRWRLTPMPPFSGGGTRASSLGGTGFGVMKDKANTQAAIDLIKYTYLTEEGQVQRFKIGGYLPTMKSAYQNEELVNYKDEYLGGQQIFQVYSELAPEVPPYYQNPGVSKLIEALGKQVVEAIKGRKSAEQAITDAAAAYEAA